MMMGYGSKITVDETGNSKANHRLDVNLKPL